MKKLSLEIHQDDLYDFFQLYDKLTPLQKNIWNKAVWWCNKFPCAFPCQSTIAKKAGCSRKHVNRTFNLFIKYKWLGLSCMGFKKPKILHIPDHLLQIDVNKRQYFKRVEVTAEVTHRYSKEEYLTSRTGAMAKQPKKEMQIPPEIAVLNFSRENSLKLSLLSPFSFQQVKEKVQKMSLSQWRPDKPEEYIVGIGINIAKSRNEKLDWASYYQQMEREKRQCSAI